MTHAASLAVIVPLAMLAASVAPPSARAEVTISADKTTANIACNGGVCAPTASGALLNSADLQSMLAAGSVTVTTHGSGVEAGSIRIVSPVTWSTATLNLIARGSITIGQMLTIGGGGLDLTTNDGGRDGHLLFTKKGRTAYKMSAGQLTINGTAYTLVSGLASLASDIAADPAGHYALAHGITAAGTYTTSPIPTTLTGTVEGLGNDITGLNIKVGPTGGNALTALFQDIGSGGLVENLTMTRLDAQVSSPTSLSVAGLAGRVEDGGMVFGVRVQGKLGSKLGAAAPIAIVNYGTIDQSSSDVDIKSYEAGGLVVTTGGDHGLIENSYSSGTIKTGASEQYAGGLASNLNGGIIQQSYSTVEITTGIQAVVGGLVSQVGPGIILNCYYIGNLSGKNHDTFGGLIGVGAENTVESSYSSNNFQQGPDDQIGGFLAENEDGTGTYLSDYWDVTVSGIDVGSFSGNVAGVTGLTHAQLQSGLPSGFSTTIWGQTASMNGGLPYLLANPPSN